MSLSNNKVSSIDYNYILFIRDFIVLNSVRYFREYHYEKMKLNKDKSTDSSTMNDMLFFFINPYNNDDKQLIWNHIFNKLYFPLQYFYQLCNRNVSSFSIYDFIHIDNPQFQPFVYETIHYDQYCDSCFRTNEEWNRYSNTETYNENLYKKYKTIGMDTHCKNYIIEQVYGIIYSPEYFENLQPPHSFLHIPHNNDIPPHTMMNAEYYLHYAHYYHYVNNKYLQNNILTNEVEEEHLYSPLEFRFIYLEKKALAYINQFI